MRKRIGIVAPQQSGDLMVCTSALKYRKELWGDADIVWFCNEPYTDLLKYQNIEIRPFPHGWGISEEEMSTTYAKRIEKDKQDGKLPWENWAEAMNDGNRLNQAIKGKFSLLTDLDEAYFPVPWMMPSEKRHGIEYSNVSKKVFGVPMDWEWHPVIEFSEDEHKEIDDFMEYIGTNKILFLETFGGSGQSIIDEDIIMWTIGKYKEYYSDGKFIFGSHKFLKNQEEFPTHLKNRNDVFFIPNFSVRECALIASWCLDMISVSSGISVAASAWGLSTPGMLQVCGSEICSTKAVSKKGFELVTTDDNSNWKEQFKEKLIRMI